MTKSNADTGVESWGERRKPATRRSTADFIYDTFYGAGVGGSIVALFFLVLDAINGQALFTPSLLGTVLFTDAPATTTLPVRIDMVAYFSILHFLAFLGAGAALSWAYSALAPFRARPILMGALAFAALTAGFALAAMIFMPGVISIIGIEWIVVGNVLAAIGMTAFLHWAHSQTDIPRVQ